MLTPLTLIPGTEFEMPTRPDHNVDIPALLRASGMSHDDERLFLTFMWDRKRPRAKFALAEVTSDAASPALLRAEIKKSPKCNYDLAHKGELVLIERYEIRRQPAHAEGAMSIGDHVIASLLEDILCGRHKPRPYLLCLNGTFGKIPFRDIRSSSVGILVKLIGG